MRLPTVDVVDRIAPPRPRGALRRGEHRAATLGADTGLRVESKGLNAVEGNEAPERLRDDGAEDAAIDD
jgi:hypothetical protein